MGIESYSKLVRISKAPYRLIMPVLAGSTLGVASLLPWLRDPVGRQFSAWQLPVDIGWQLRSSMFSYGVLCCCEALFAFWIAIQVWITLHTEKEISAKIREQSSQATCCTVAGLLCLLLSAVFLTQYLDADMGSIARLTNHEIQALLIRRKLGYGLATQVFPIDMISFDPITLRGRVALLLDQIGIGSFLPLASALILLSSRWLFLLPVRASPTRKRRAIIWGSGLILFLLVVLGRAPAALVCNYQAQLLLAQGNYAKALSWLDRAEKLNPSLDQLSSYHIERGYAWYFLHPEQPTVDSQVYLAAFYRQQNDILSSYQELLAARQRAPEALWVLDEFTVTLERLAEMSLPLNGPLGLRVKREVSSLTWLYQLSQADPSDVYAHYVIGRIQYDLQDYNKCEVQMLAVLKVAQENDIVSSAYTYLGLSRFGQGDLIAARQYLFKAQDLDPTYRNNTAREELSGLR
jgi:tetratricopeptide (TPR) repeat protein